MDRQHTATLESDGKLKDRSKGYRIPRKGGGKGLISAVQHFCVLVKTKQELP